MGGAAWSFPGKAASVSGAGDGRSMARLSASKERRPAAPNWAGISRLKKETKSFGSMEPVVEPGRMAVGLLKEPKPVPPESRGVRSRAWSARRMEPRTAEWTMDWSRKRTSSLAGWTLTSTASGDISIMRTAVG
ncbi:MAG: hypothetical protein KF705_06885 [Phycisphaeraceae bacterium]|nr:hypothetical protein [Phycisphaeraceae bacterium]